MAPATASPRPRASLNQLLTFHRRPRHHLQLRLPPTPPRNPRRLTEEPASPAKKIYTVPAGTKVLLQLKSAINTRSAKAGDGVYLISIFPVVVGNRVMIPTGVYVQGVVDRVQRGGRIKGKAQLDMHFTSIIFPNGSVVEIPGVVDSMPGVKEPDREERRGGNHRAKRR